MDAANLIEIFRPGRFTALSGQTLEFSEADLKAAADSYDPSLHEAPLVVGHPKTDSPAYGWVEKLAYDGRLKAATRQVDPRFAELVKTGRYKKISASFYLPDSPANPMPGVYYLRHVGFLGAQPPAVKGLRDASFDDAGQGVVTLEFSEPPTQEPDMADKPTDKQTTQDVSAAEFAERQAELERKRRELEAKEAEFAEREKRLVMQEAARRQKETADFIEKLAADGKVLPRDQAGLVALLTSIDDQSQVEFAEEGQVVKQPAITFLRKFLEGLPRQVDYSERVPPQADGGNVDFAAPPGYSVDQAGMELHRKAVAYLRSHRDVDYETALEAVK